MVVSKESLDKAIEQIRRNIENRCLQHGKDAFKNKHEGLGIITEEYHELIDAIRENDRLQVKAEAGDIAVGCIWLIASLIEEYRNR